ncbi:hypothetical protein [Solicola sp. PLA-1-18]|uniref:hypothetical protein n=1 Tax=Solicola sp. PLA-1-18 TaxID=3380532 RepID=UPI003B80BD92
MTTTEIEGRQSAPAWKTLSIIAVVAGIFMAAMYFVIVPSAGQLSIDSACNANTPKIPYWAGVSYTSELHWGWRPHWTCEYRIAGEVTSVDVGWAPS